MLLTLKIWNVFCCQWPLTLTLSNLQDRKKESTPSCLWVNGSHWPVPKGAFHKHFSNGWGGWRGNVPSNLILIMLWWSSQLHPEVYSVNKVYHICNGLQNITLSLFHCSSILQVSSSTLVPGFPNSKPCPPNCPVTLGLCLLLPHNASSWVSPFCYDFRPKLPLWSSWASSFPAHHQSSSFLALCPAI